MRLKLDQAWPIAFLPAEELVMRAATLPLALLLLAGCTKDDSAQVAMAQDAYEKAQDATQALDAGTASGTTMGNELEEAVAAAAAAQQAANDAKQVAAKAYNRANDLEVRLDTICRNAPAACD